MTTIIEERPGDRPSNSRKCAASHNTHDVRSAMLSPVSITHSKTPISPTREEERGRGQNRHTNHANNTV